MRQVLKLKRGKLLLLFPIAVLILILARVSPFVAEYIFARGVYKILSLPLGFVTGLFPFSIAEIIILSLPFIVLAVLSLFVWKIIKNKGKRKYILQKGVINVMCFISIVSFLFVVLCGTNYYRYDFETYLDFKTSDHTTSELYDLCMYLKDRAEEEKSLIDKSEINEDGVVVTDRDFSQIADNAQEAMDNLAEKYSVLKYSTGGAKEVIMSRYMSYGGIVGIFIPFTMEANVNTDVADYNRPADTCHELAHMRGFMKEEEANYISYLACIGDDDPVFRYSGYMLAFIHSTNALYNHDAALYYEVMDSLSDSVKADMIYENEYRAEIQESKAAQVADSVATSVNDAYLKVNGQEDGVNSYGMMVDLLLAEYLSTNERTK